MKTGPDFLSSFRRERGFGLIALLTYNLHPIQIPCLSCTIVWFGVESWDCINFRIFSWSPKETLCPLAIPNFLRPKKACIYFLCRFPYSEHSVHMMSYNMASYDWLFSFSHLTTLNLYQSSFLCITK